MGITEILREQCPRCKKRDLKCRDKKHYAMAKYKDGALQFAAYELYMKDRISHVLKHFEHTIAILAQDTYCPHIPNAVLFFREHREWFTWEHISANKDVLDLFIENDVEIHTREYGSILGFINQEYFQDKEIHGILEESIETMNLADYEP